MTPLPTFLSSRPVVSNLLLVLASGLSSLLVFVLEGVGLYLTMYTFWFFCSFCFVYSHSLKIPQQSARLPSAGVFIFRLFHFFLAGLQPRDVHLSTILSLLGQTRVPVACQSVPRPVPPSCIFVLSFETQFEIREAFFLRPAHAPTGLPLLCPLQTKIRSHIVFGFHLLPKAL